MAGVALAVSGSVIVANAPSLKPWATLVAGFALAALGILALMTQGTHHVAVIRGIRSPLSTHDRMFGGLGSAAVCPICAEPIARRQPRIEIEFNRHGMRETHHLHPRCFAAWEFERTKGKAPPDDFSI